MSVRRWILAVGALVCAPLLAVSVWLFANDHWAPLFDVALMEMRVRDVGTAHTPLLGLGGRLGRAGEGHHPGPLGFYLLAPLYRVLGGSYWSLRVSAAALSALALVGSLFIAGRRAGAAGVIVAGLVIGALELGFGLLIITEPWNPHLPVLWFFPFLLAVWSVLDGDVKLLPIAVGLGSLCGQTHIPYLAVCGGLGLIAALATAVYWARAERGSEQRRRISKASAIAVAVAVVAWTPPLLDEWQREPGNLKILWDYFTNTPAPSLGPLVGGKLLLERLDPWFLLVESLRTPGILRLALAPAQPSALRGLVLLVVWIAAAGTALRLRERTLNALHGCAAAAIAAGFLAASRIVGPPWVYLVFSLWTVGGLLLLAILFTVSRLLQRGSRVNVRGQRTAAALGVACTVIFTARVISSVPQAGSSSPVPSRQLAVLARAAADAIHQRRGAPEGARGKYLVSWGDAYYYGSQGVGLVVELERRGLRAFLPAGVEGAVGAHRSIKPRDATARVHIANAGHIAEARAKRGATQIAEVDLRTPEERSEYTRLHAAVLKRLRQFKRKNAARLLEHNVPGSTVRGMTGEDWMKLTRMTEIGSPAAIFILPAR